MKFSNALNCVLFEARLKLFSPYTVKRYKNSASVYVHWPYCEKRCTYCNFNKYISNNVDHARMRKCLITETRTLLKVSGVDRVTSIFFGGGTPSLAEPETIRDVIDTIKSNVIVDGDVEISMEGNPTSLETERLKEFKDAGVNRLSVGLQALNDKDLRLLGRNHDVAEAMACIHEAKQLFYGKVSVDVIFGRPQQTLEGWTDELEKLMPLLDGHVSLYQLTPERGTALFKSIQKNELDLPSDDIMADMYVEGVKKLEEVGLNRYEVANFAKKDAESQHNMSYWMLDEYIGIGPGAHSRFRNRSTGSDHRSARIQTLEPNNWMYEVETMNHGTRRIVPLSQLDLLQECLALGLRTTRGITHERWNYFSGGIGLNDVFNTCSAIEKHETDGFLEFTGRTYIRATSSGINILDSIIPDLLAHLQTHWCKINK